MLTEELKTLIIAKAFNGRHINYNSLCQELRSTMAVGLYHVHDLSDKVGVDLVNFCRWRD